MVKNITAHVVKPLKHICNVSFNTGIFPNQMKITKVILSAFSALVSMDLDQNISTSHALIELVDNIEHRRDGGLEVDREIDNFEHRRDGGLEVDREIAMRHQRCN